MIVTVLPYVSVIELSDEKTPVKPCEAVTKSDDSNTPVLLPVSVSVTFVHV